MHAYLGQSNAAAHLSGASHATGALPTDAGPLLEFDPAPVGSVAQGHWF